MPPCMARELLAELIMPQVPAIEVEGTEGGGEFVTREQSLGQLRALVGMKADALLPYFELWLPSKRVGGVTTKLTIAAFRIVRL